MSFSTNRISGLLASAIVITLAGAVEVGAQIDLSGDWIFAVTTDTGTTYPEVTLVQDGATLTGSYSSEALGEADISGSVMGSEMTFSFSADLGGQIAPVVYTGTVDEDTGEITGEMDIAGGLLMGDFTATRADG